MEIIRIFNTDYPNNRRIQFKYTSNYYYAVLLEEKEDNSGWNIDLVKTPFKGSFIKNAEENLFEDYKKDTEYYIAINDDVEVGFISFGPQEWNKTARIWDICVYEKFQNQKIGTKLLTFIENRVKEWNCRALVLECQSSNYSAIQLYKKNGFKLSGFYLYAYSNTDIEKNEVRLEMTKLLT